MQLLIFHKKRPLKFLMLLICDYNVFVKCAH